MSVNQDVHFLIDNASPTEVEHVLRCLDSQVAYSTEELRTKLLADWGYAAQKNLTFSTRRLLDVGLSQRATTASGKPGHVITPLGVVVRGLLDSDQALYADVMHYLHYHSWDGRPETRKLFWSYRQCCEIIWNRRELPSAAELVSGVQTQMATSFPDLYASRVGGNFNAGGANSGWKPWVAQLDPPPFGDRSSALQPRTVSRFELTLLALEDVYQSRGYRHGDPVIVDDQLLDDIARVFFLDASCCRELIDVAARITRVIKLADTFAGTSVTLLEPYGVERI